ncbi:MAG: C45 family autoproteolytic acyltransferase/hydrolase [Alistipes finegoldii]
MRYQEQVFVDQIREFIPSDGYLKFLRGLIVIFNRNLGRHVPEEYRREIYARSLYCSHDFDAIGTPYERQLNYHAAHDIGHAMSQYMLVGCSSFAAWGGASDDGKPVVGRNFDFYMGDDFTRNKIVTFCRPQAGHPFASIGWAGMIGVLSGMNDKGLTVTINAAKGPVPLGGDPISILAREILQHAATIGEASKSPAPRHLRQRIAARRIGARRKGRNHRRRPARPPCTTAANTLVCTNHYQSTELPATGNLETSPGRTAPIASPGSKSSWRRMRPSTSRQRPPCCATSAARAAKTSAWGTTVR